MSDKITLIKHIKKINYFVLDEITMPLINKSSFSDKKSKSIYFTYFAYALFFKIHNFDNMSSLILGNIILMFSFFISVFVSLGNKRECKREQYEEGIFFVEIKKV